MSEKTERLRDTRQVKTERKLKFFEKNAHFLQYGIIVKRLT